MKRKYCHFDQRGMDGFDSKDNFKINSDSMDMISKDGFGLTPVEALDSISIF